MARSAARSMPHSDTPISQASFAEDDPRGGRFVDEGLQSRPLTSTSPFLDLGFRRKRPRFCAPSGSLLVTGSPPLGVRRSARRTCSACDPPAGRRPNDNNQHRGENVMNAPDTILYRGLFTTPLVAALRRTVSETAATAKPQQTSPRRRANPRI
jgi:hypothetical protein